MVTALVHSKVLKQGHSELSLQAHQCPDTVPDLNNMVYAVQALGNGELGVLNSGSTKKTFRFDRVFTPSGTQVSAKKIDPYRGDAKEEGLNKLLYGVFGRDNTQYEHIDNIAKVVSESLQR
ncbi:hypothetical protein L6452_15454 [Arctium lappa]|uniref:Uncharacterized protein n=1 Tax=Arctium lappa TaxID=4217 RepID=A0ACB9CPE4_ARCLA|nr:hypothetical protein L6452_15454 [Arctium lappa]